VVKLVDTHASGACGSNPVKVRVLSPAREKFGYGVSFRMTGKGFAPPALSCVLRATPHINLNYSLRMRQT
jgi:hypothetical protein